MSDECTKVSGCFFLNHIIIDNKVNIITLLCDLA